MERPPYNNLCGQNRVQILLSDSRETPLFSLGKNTHTKKNKEFEHNRFRTVLLRRVGHRRRHSNRTPGLAVKLPSSTQNVKKYCMYVLVWEYLKKNLSRTNLPRSSSNFFIDGIVPSAVLDGFQVPAKEKRGTRGK